MNAQVQTSFNVLVIGDSCIDEYHYGVVDKISPEAPVPIFKFKYKELKDGMAANVKENLLKLECSVTSILSNPSKKIRLIDDRSKQHIVRIDQDLISLPFIYDSLDLNQYDSIVISDYDKGFISYELIECLRKDFNGPIFVDTKKRNLSRFNGCFVKINELEYSLATSFCDDIILTLGSAGASYKGIAYPACHVEVSDVCGAGDTFLASLTYRYLQTKSISDAIRFAIIASSITIQHVGVYAPSIDEIL